MTRHLQPDAVDGFCIATAVLGHWLEVFWHVNPSHPLLNTMLFRLSGPPSDAESGSVCDTVIY